MRALIEFWTEIMQTHPNIDKLSVTGERARQHLNASIAHWERLLEINPDNVQMLRLYGMFCLEIIGDVQRAQDLFSKAETLIRNKQRLMIDSNYGDFLRKVNIDLDIFDEENGVVGVSIDPESIGIVNNVNPAFLRMFGFSSRGDIVGKSINTIIPSPMKVRVFRSSLLCTYSEWRCCACIVYATTHSAPYDQFPLYRLSMTAT